MKKLILVMLLAAGVVLYADAVFARGGGGAGAGASGAPAASGASTGGEAAAGPSSGAATGSDTSAIETGPGDRLGGPPAGYTNDPSIYRSPASAWPGEVEYPSASPRGPAVIAPPAVIVTPPAVVVVPAAPAVVTPPGRIEVPSTPLMCPGVNATDPRKC